MNQAILSCAIMSYTKFSSENYIVLKSLHVYTVAGGKPWRRWGYLPQLLLDVVDDVTVHTIIQLFLR